MSSTTQAKYVESGQQSRDSGDEVPSQESDPEDPKSMFNAWSICAMGVMTVVGRQYYKWNEYLVDGFGFFAVSQIVMALAYLIYVSSLAEIVSAFPFSGGGFGLARVTQGYFVGFLVGCLESLEYIAYSALAFLYLSEQICVLCDINKYYAIAFAFVFYASAGLVTIHRGRFYLQFTYALACISVVILLIYCFGTMKYLDFMENASRDEYDDNHHVQNWYVGGVRTFMMAMPSATIAYGGIEAMTLLPTLTVEPKRSIPRGMLWALAILFVCNMLVVVVFASQPGGIIATSKMDYPMTVGFSLMFGMPAVYGRLLMLPAQFAEGFGFILCFGKLLQSLGTTNLLPSFLCLRDCHDHTNGVIVGCTLGFLICVIYRIAGQNLLDQCVMLGFLNYLSQLHGYWMLKTKYSTSVREFHSPFGLLGVAYSALVFAFGAIGIVIFEREQHTLKIVGTIVGVLTVYYFAFAAKSQTMADEEMSVLFQLHVAKFNKRKKTKPSKKVTTRPNMVVPIIRKLSEQSLVEVGLESRTEMPSQLDSGKPTLRAEGKTAAAGMEIVEETSEHRLDGTDEKEDESLHFTAVAVGGDRLKLESLASQGESEKQPEDILSAEEKVGVTGLGDQHVSPAVEECIQRREEGSGQSAAVAEAEEAAEAPESISEEIKDTSS